LVLGLAAGGSTRGVAYRVAATDWPATYAYLLEREQPTETYFEAWAKVRFETGETAKALVFLSNTSHPQWAGVMDLEAQARLIAGASGLSGRNIDYLRDLVEHLRAEGVGDAAMERLLVQVEALEGEGR
jgi:cation transport protein ChaC